MATRVKPNLQAEFVNFEAARDELLRKAGVNSWKREMIASIVSTFTACGVYVAGISAATWLSVIALTASGSMFISMFVLVLGAVISFVASCSLITPISNYISDGIIDRHWDQAVSFVGRVLPVRINFGPVRVFRKEA